MKAKTDINICTVCETGKNDYLLDRTSVFCSYIDCLKDGKCSMFCPIKNNECGK